MQCPNCSNTFKPTVLTCPDCNVPLVVSASSSGSWGDSTWSDAPKKPGNTDLEGWWDQGPEASVAKPAPPVEKEPEVEDDWTAAPPALPRIGGPSAGDVGSEKEEPDDGWGMTASASQEPEPVKDGWSVSKQEQEPVKDGWSVSKEEPEPVQDGWSVSKEESEPAKDGWSVSKEESAKENSSSSQPVADGPAIPDEALPSTLLSDDDLPSTLTAEEIAWIEDGVMPLKRVEESSQPAQVSLVMVAVIVAVIAFPLVYKLTLMKWQKAASMGQTITIEEDAATWLASSEQSRAAKDYPLAVAQLKRAIELLGREGADAKTVQKTKITLAHTYFKAGQFVDSRELWLELGKNDSKLGAQALEWVKKSNRELRVRANAKVKEAKTLIKKQPKSAIKLATEAIELYSDSEGQPGQLANAHGTLADTYRQEGEIRMATIHYKLADELDPSGPYRAKLKKLGPVGRRPKSAPKSVKPKRPPSFVPKTKIPRVQ